jgi:hypothetical protein
MIYVDPTQLDISDYGFPHASRMQKNQRKRQQIPPLTPCLPAAYAPISLPLTLSHQETREGPVITQNDVGYG